MNLDTKIIPNSTLQPSRFHSKEQCSFNIQKSVNTSHHLSRINKKSHMIISVVREKVHTYDKIHTPNMIRPCKILELGKNSLNLTKRIYENLCLMLYLVVKD